MGAGAMGAHAIPINWHSTADEVSYILTHSGAKAVVVHADLLPALADAIPANALLLVAEPSQAIGSCYGLESSSGAVGTGWNPPREDSGKLFKPRLRDEYLMGRP